MRVRSLEALLVSALVLAVFWSPLQGNLKLGAYTDFLYHARLAEEQWHAGGLRSGYFLFHGLAIAVSFAAGSMEQAAIWVVLAARVASALLLVWFFAPAPGETGSRLAVAAIALGAMVVTPITLFTITAHNTYAGYIAINTHHNPTVEVLRPIALGSFIALGAWFSTRDARLLWLFGGLTLLSVIAKPSYALCLYPALLLFFFELPRSERVRRGAALAVALVPTALVQVAQFHMYYGDAADSRIAFAPFAVLHEPLPVVAAKIALSVAFPAAVTWLFASDVHLRLAWRLFAAGLLLHLAFAETGPRLEHGNFGWSSQIALFLLFVAALRVWARALFRPGNGAAAHRLVATAIILGLHLASGVVFLSLYWTASGGRGWY